LNALSLKSRGDGELVSSEIRLPEFLLHCLLLLILSGCAPAANQFSRVSVEGMVTLDGEPLESGNITWLPVTDGPVVSGTILDGQYQIEQSQGPAAGEYRVEIDAVRPTGNKVPDTVGDKLVDEYANQVPDRYNRNSELKVTIKSNGDQQHHFKLISRD